MSIQLFNKVGSAIYGAEWQAPIARDLNVNERSLRRWIAGAEEVPRGVWLDLGVILGTKHQAFGRLIEEVNRAAELIQVHAFRVWDNRSGEMTQPPAKSTAERISLIGGEIIPESAEWVSPSLINAEGRMRSENMMINLSSVEYDLLAELNRLDGRARLAEPDRRANVDRLVSEGYAKSRALNVSDIECEIAQAGRAALVLRGYGIPTTLFTLIEPHRHDDGLWYIKVSSEGNPATMLSMGAATRLVAELRSVVAGEFADQFQAEIDRTRIYASACYFESQAG